MRQRLLIVILCIVFLAGYFNIASAAADNIPQGYDKVGETSKLSLYYNSKLGSIIVEDKRTSFLWKSAITEEEYNMTGVNDVWKNNMKSLFNLTYINFKDNKGTQVTINSGMENPKVTAKSIDKGLSISYEYQKLKISVTLDISLEEEGLNVRIPIEKIKEGDQYGLTSIEVLPFFGSASDDKKGYIFYPDGCGALLNYKNTSHGDATKYSWYIYGQDSVDLEAYRIASRSDEQQALLPVYGIKQGDNALAAIVSEGEQDTEINLYPSGFVVNLNRISPEFTYRRSYKDARPNAKMVNKIEKDIIKQSHAVKYMFMVNDQASYSGMANAYRSYLVDSGNIKKSINTGDKLPLGLDLFMGISENRLIFDKFIPMTTFQQAKDIIDSFHNSGIPNMQVNLIGWTDKGYGKFPVVWPPSGALGGKKELSKLAAYTSEKSDKLYLQSNFVDALKQNGGFSSRNDVVYSKNNLVVTNLLKNRFILSPAAILSKFMNGFLPEAKSSGVTGVNFEKFGSLLYYDYNKNYPAARKDTSDYWDKLLNESGTQLGSAAVMGGNAYVFKYANRLFDIPVKDSGYFITDEKVPFYQMVVHGLIPYSADPANLFYDLPRQKLNWVEYGCIPYFKLTYESPNLMKNADYNHLFSSYYKDWTETASEIYKEFNERLGDVWSQVMVSHEKLKDDIYKVTYQNGTVIYINYSEKDINIDGIDVKPIDYTVVDKEGRKR